MGAPGRQLPVVYSGADRQRFLGLKQALDLVAQLVDGKRLADHRHAGRDLQVLGVAAGEQDRQLRAQCARRRGQLAAIHAGKADIGHQQVDADSRILDDIQRLLAAGGLKHVEVEFFEHVDDQHTHDGIVFDD